MKRREFTALFVGLFALHRAAIAGPADPMKIEKVVLADAQWQKRLSPEAFKVLRHEGTEYAGSSPLNAEKRKEIGRASCRERV